MGRAVGARRRAGEPTRGSACWRSRTGGCRRPTTPTAHTRRAGLELWATGAEWPRRAAGEVLCGSSLDLGSLRLDCSFFRWHLEGHARRRPLRHPRAAPRDRGRRLGLRRRAHDAAAAGLHAHPGRHGRAAEAFGAALARATATDGAQPAVRARGRRDLRARVPDDARARARARGSAARSRCTGSASATWRRSTPNDELFAYYRTLHARGVRLAMLTNNVREWEPLWRAKLPVDEIFETVVDSALRRHAQARSGDLRDRARAARRCRPRRARSSTTSRSTSTAARALGLTGGALPRAPSRRSRSSTRS